jgi:AraC-like DNA-binding protein
MNDRVLTAKMIAYIENNLLEPITAEDLALRSGYSLNRFRQKFYNITGDTPSGYIRKRRLSEAAKEILSGSRIIDTALRWGYSSQENFTTSFRSYFGITPKELSQIEGKYRRFFRRMREAYSIMELTNLKQPPIDTTLMGCIKGASDYYEQDYSPALLFGLTGHAFLINIHDELCPSGPYVWKKERFNALLENIGLKVEAQHCITAKSSEEERRELEEKMKAHLNGGGLCMLDFLEHQLISGYDEQSFLTLMPWNGCASSEVPLISAGTWKECFDKEGWAAVTMIVSAGQTGERLQAVREGLRFGLDSCRNGGEFEREGYRIGLPAYDSWIAGVRNGKGKSHGHWWNGMVWSECRRYAAEFFSELPGFLSGNDEDAEFLSLCAALEKKYRGLSDTIAAAKEKNLAAEKQEELLSAARAQEEKAIELLEQLCTVI